ncbi:MAG: helix-turn-helix domain-containing protein, partial [Gammaproteobacteria bacterium]
KLSGGLSIDCHRSLASLDRSDLIFIPGVWGSISKSVRQNEPLLQWLRQAYSNGSTLCAVTTGSHFLAAAGLLDGKTATTHWHYFDQFEQLYPRVKLQRSRFITRAAGIYCTGSVNAVRDIMLHFIARAHGESIASVIAQHFTHELKRSYEAMLLDRDQHSSHHDETIIKVQEWLQENYPETIHIENVAERFQMSVRSLNRRFKSASNITPLQYLQTLRIEHAKDLLKQTNLSIAEVADRVGYQDASYFTGLFRRLNAVTPNQYRSLVRSKQFLVETGPEPVH